MVLSLYSLVLEYFSRVCGKILTHSFFHVVSTNSYYWRNCQRNPSFFVRGAIVTDKKSMPKAKIEINDQPRGTRLLLSAIEILTVWQAKELNAPFFKRPILKKCSFGGFDV